MALLFADGFEQYNNRDRLIESNNWNTSSSLSGVPIEGRQGAGSRALQNGLNGGVITHFVPALASGIAGFAYLARNTAPGSDILTMIDGSTEQLVLRASAGELILDRVSETTVADTSDGL